jgi:hypothetical protein
MRCEIPGGNESNFGSGFFPGLLAFAPCPLRDHQTFHSRTPRPAEARSLVERWVYRVVKVASRSTMKNRRTRMGGSVVVWLDLQQGYQRV